MDDPRFRRDREEQPSNAGTVRARGTSLALEDVRDSIAAGSTSLLLRHAAREPILDSMKWREAALTPDGRDQAHRLGRDLAVLLRPGERIVLRHSPIPRCRDTAAEILSGLADGGHDVGPSLANDDLGGPFVRDPPAVFDLVGRMGLPGLLREWFDGRIPTTLLDPLATAAKGQVACACEASRGARLAILVTHDWNVLTIREHYFGLRHEADGWAGFLDGIAVARAADARPVLRLGRRAMTIA